MTTEAKGGEMTKVFTMTEAEWLASQTEWACAECGASVEAEWAFCPHCGFDAAAEPGA